MSIDDTLLHAEYGRRLVDELGAVPGNILVNRATCAIRDLALAIAAEGFDYRAAVAEALDAAEGMGAAELATWGTETA